MPYNRKAFSGDYATETFYFPLSVQVEDEDSEDLYSVSSDSVRWFEDEIQEAIDDYQSDIEMERYLCDDNADIQRKLISAEWGVETLNGELYGRMKLTLKEPLTVEETEQMRGRRVTVLASHLNSTRLRWTMRSIMCPSGTAVTITSSTPPMKWTNISASRPDRASAECKKAVCILHWR